jgi:hypothetical protein
VIVEMTRLLADRLAADLPAVVAALPRDAGDPLPTIGPVLDATRHETAVGDLSQATAPCLVVDLTMDRWSPTALAYPSEGSLSTTIRICRATDNKAHAQRDAGLILRGVRAVVMQLLQSNEGMPARTRNGVTAMGLQSYDGGITAVETGSLLIAAAAQITFLASDRP